MAHVSDLIAQDIHAYLQQHQHKSLLRFIACGSVDHGKSSLLGRLLFDAGLVLDDQIDALRKDTGQLTDPVEDLDFSLLFDGLDVPVFYDSMLGKLIVWAEDRDLAIKRMRRAPSLSCSSVAAAKPPCFA